MRLVLAAGFAMGLLSSASAESLVKVTVDYRGCYSYLDAARFHTLMTGNDSMGRARFAIRTVQERNKGHEICEDLAEGQRAEVVEINGDLTCIHPSTLAPDRCLWVPGEYLEIVKTSRKR